MTEDGTHNMSRVVDLSQMATWEFYPSRSAMAYAYESYQIRQAHKEGNHNLVSRLYEDRRYRLRPEAEQEEQND